MGPVMVMVVGMIMRMMVMMMLHFYAGHIILGAGGHPSNSWCRADTAARGPRQEGRSNCWEATSPSCHQASHYCPGPGWAGLELATTFFLLVTLVG